MWKFFTKVRGKAMQLTSVQQSRGEQRERLHPVFCGEGKLFKTSVRVVCDTEAYNQDTLKKKSSPIISIFIAIKNIGHDFILSAIFQILPF